MNATHCNNGSRQVNPPDCADRSIRPADLRAYFARYNIEQAEVARRRGTDRKAVNSALRADIYGRPVSQALLREILTLANQILLEREQAPRISPPGPGEEVVEGE